jgi:Glycosyltransferase family 9 (heptosyltransferase)
VISRGDPMPEISCHCPLMSLPLIFDTTIETIPSFRSYLSVSEKEIESAKQLWPGDGVRVGLVWSGNPEHKADVHRSMSLEQLIPLGTVPGVSFYSLQVGTASRQTSEVSSSFSVADVCSGFTDFADTAAFVSGLDLVIAVDTAVAHLAGALGVPVWILIANCKTDWRWFRDRTDTPWYPNARIFRQTTPDDWKYVVFQVREALEQLSRNSDKGISRNIGQGSLQSHRRTVK